MSNEHAITIENVSKTFNIPQDRKTTLKSVFVNLFKRSGTKKFHAVNRVNLEIRKGEFISFIGRNGSGKSTLLKLVAGIYTPDKGGKIKLEGKLVPFLELGVGFNPDLSGKENIYLNGTILGMTQSYLDSKYEEIVRFAELKDFMEMPVKNYSSGMLVRLAFSIAIQADADIYILDEILAVGDSNFQQKCIRVVQKLKKQGKTIILVSHSLTDVKQYSDRVIVMEQGKPVFVGDPDEAVEKYRDVSAKHNQELMEMDKEAQTYNWASRIPQSRDYVIKKITTLDINRQPRDEFDTGEDFIIRVTYSDEKKADTNLNCSIGIHSIDDQTVVFGISTLDDEVRVDRNSGLVDLVIKHNTLNTGTYFLSGILFKDQPDQYHNLLPIADKFEIVNKGKRFLGRTLLNHSWGDV